MATAEEKIDVKALEDGLDRALKAYNDDDSKKFWAEFCRGVGREDLVGEILRPAPVPLVERGDRPVEHLVHGRATGRPRHQKTMLTFGEERCSRCKNTI